MNDVVKFRRYAENCRLFSNSMNAEHKMTLLEIAAAWDQAAEEAESEELNRKKGAG
jgi:hypothetical protein